MSDRVDPKTAERIDAAMQGVAQVMAACGIKDFVVVAEVGDARATAKSNEDLVESMNLLHRGFDDLLRSHLEANEAKTKFQ